MKSLSDLIRECRDGVVKNPYQSSDKKVVFVCSMGILRSATGARLYANKYNTRSAGTWDDALTPLTPLLIDWADELVFVNEKNYLQVVDKLINSPMKLEEVKNKSVVLNIPDDYPHMSPELIQAFKEQYEDF